jgi:hypothetical protein
MSSGLIPGKGTGDDDVVRRGGPWLWTGVGEPPTLDDLTVLDEDEVEPADSGYEGRHRVVPGRHRVDPDDPPEPKGFGTDPYGRTPEDWKTHAE